MYALALEDLAEAAALFRPQWEHTGGADGYVSLEVPPDVAYDAAATVAFARRLQARPASPTCWSRGAGLAGGLPAIGPIAPPLSIDR